MAQANIKDRIKEMRLRVFAEPLSEAAAQTSGNKTDEYDIQVDEVKATVDNLETGTLVREKTTQTRSVKKPKSGKKKKSKNSRKEKHGKATDTTENMLQPEYNARTDVQVEEIGEADINLLAETKEPLEISELIADNNSIDEHKKSSGEIIELTDKWVELEVRSRLSGLEKQEKQTRAMLKEIVEILDRIETPKQSNQASPAVSEKEIVPTFSTSQILQTKKRYWIDILKRIFVVIGTFVIFVGVIWGISLYLFSDI